jgi:hypothetical protein
LDLTDLQENDDGEDVAKKGAPPHPEDDDDDTEEDGAARPILSTYIRPKRTNPEFRDRQERKNNMSRNRAQRRRDLVQGIYAKPESAWTDDERSIVQKIEAHRGRKNCRSRERASEIKQQVDLILQKPDHERTKRELQFLHIHMDRKTRKNEGDRLRRKRMKMLGIPFNNRSELSEKPRVSARGPLPPEWQEKLGDDQHQQQPRYPYPSSYHMGHHPAYHPGSSPHLHGYGMYPPPVGMDAGPSFTVMNGRMVETGYPPPPWVYGDPAAGSNYAWTDDAEPVTKEV